MKPPLHNLLVFTTLFTNLSLIITTTTTTTLTSAFTTTTTPHTAHRQQRRHPTFVITNNPPLHPSHLRKKSSPSPLFSSSSTTQHNDVVPKTGGQGQSSTSDTALLQSLTLGAPPSRPTGGHYLTKGGIQVTAHVTPLEYSLLPKKEGTSGEAIERLIDGLDDGRGVLLSSSYEFPGRYARWSLGFLNPPIEISGRGLYCTLKALNERGHVILPSLKKAMEALKEEGVLEYIVFKDDGVVEVKVVDPPPVGTFEEEERSKQPSLFSVVRSIINLFEYTDGDGQLGLYGAFGYDLTFQFEPITLTQNRSSTQRDLLLYLPDDIIVVDQAKNDAWRLEYDFNVDNQSTQGLERTTSPSPFLPPPAEASSSRDTPAGTFASSVERAKREFSIGNLFEVVLSQTFSEPLSSQTPPSILYRRLRSRNPAPYGFFMNLGDGEYLVGASPEMFVRCEQTATSPFGEGRLRVETCPISGTVARGKDALEDAQRVKSLILNAKEESELTMCTDVDRNDKSRICEPGSVSVIGRRQIEMYSRLIHTVDHVEGYLREGFDALDAFLCHTWAVTVTGAPKTWAMRFLEREEKSPRCWYGGAVGMVGFDGTLNTGLTLRTIRVKDGIAEVRAGATLLYDSNPQAEELETELKASAMIDAILRSGPEDDDNSQSSTLQPSTKATPPGANKSVILIDHQDSFVHTLGNYLRQTGARVTTLRTGPNALATISQFVADGHPPDMVVLSPGPGNPSDFKLSDTISLLEKYQIPTFGVCLGLQGMVEHFGGRLGVLSYPMHGKPSAVSLVPSKTSSQKGIFEGLPDRFEVARYHSLYGLEESLPECMEILAKSDDGIAMAVRHTTLPMAAVQFHPESILTSPEYGMAILTNALMYLGQKDDSNDGRTQK